MDIDHHHGKCAWTYSDGCRCTNTASMSPSFAEGTGTTSGQGTKSKWYCAWHYECLVSHLEDNYDTDAYRKWYANRNKKSRIPKASEGWDENDIWQIKGLVIAGESSLAWRLAPEAARQKALALSKGWIPPKYEMPDIDAEERAAIQAEACETYDILGKVRY